MTALELTALALVSRLLARETAPRAPQAVTEIARDVPDPVDPQTFLTDGAGEDAHYYRAHDGSGEVLAGFYADGRVRLADRQHRLAGIVQNGHADLLEIADNTWSEFFVRETPEGRLQVEFRGGPYDARVLMCDPLDSFAVNA